MAITKSGKKRDKLRARCKELGIIGYSRLSNKDMEVVIANREGGKPSPLPQPKVEVKKEEPKDLVQVQILAAVTIQENVNDTEYPYAHKFQVVRNGDVTKLMRSSDSRGQSVCQQEVVFPTEGLIEAFEHVVSAEFKALPSFETKHSSVSVTRKDPQIAVKDVAGDNTLYLSRSAKDDVYVEIAGYGFYFNEEDVAKLADLLKTDLVVKTATQDGDPVEV